MYSGMTRNESFGLLALVVLIASGLGIRSCANDRGAGGVWVEQAAVSEAESRPGGGRVPGGALPRTAKKASSPAASETSALDLNAAGELDLADRLPGIGEVRAKAIVAYRKEHGGFRDVRELLQVPGIGEGMLKKIAPLVFVKTAEVPALTSGSAPTSASIPAAPPAGLAPLADPAPSVPGLASPLTSASRPAAPPSAPVVPSTASPRHTAAPTPALTPPDAPVNLNTASSEELQTLYEIGPVRAEAIIAFRKQHGPFRRVEDLDKVPGIGPTLLQRNRARLRVR